MDGTETVATFRETGSIADGRGRLAVAKELARPAVEVIRQMVSIRPPFRELVQLERHSTMKDHPRLQY